MSEPKEYELKKEGEFQRLLLELESYMKVSVNDGTDRQGRLAALKALQDLNRNYRPVLTWDNYPSNNKQESSK